MAPNFASFYFFLFFFFPLSLFFDLIGAGIYIGALGCGVGTQHEPGNQQQLGQQATGMQGQWLEQTVGHEITLLASDRHRAAGSHKQVISQFPPVVSGLWSVVSLLRAKEWRKRLGYHHRERKLYNRHRQYMNEKSVLYQQYYQQRAL
ncbi:hypothetical protein HDV63DRAFT_302666 [Trichoderma sp. SZMC 28014]